MQPWLDDTDVQLYHGDCVDVMASLDAGSIDAVITDPPYGIGFMGHQWDQPGFLNRPNGSPGTDSRILNGGAVTVGRYDQTRAGHLMFQEWCERWALASARVLRPGGHLVSFGGTRTYHRLAAGVEDAGLEIRDQLAWLFGSGFPKSIDLGREVGPEWKGWGTGLKPGHEPVVLARRPLGRPLRQHLADSDVGAIHIDACRIPVVDVDYARNHSGDRGHAGTRTKEQRGVTDLRTGGGSASTGRWPSNVILDDQVAELLDEQSGERQPGANPPKRGIGYGGGSDGVDKPRDQLDGGGASRFYYCAKPSDAERGAGNTHPTVKPVALMRWLIRLVVPAGGIILDPFAGSGTTAVAARMEGVRCIGVDRELDYLLIAARRLGQQSLLTGGVA